MNQLASISAFDARPIHRVVPSPNLHAIKAAVRKVELRWPSNDRSLRHYTDQHAIDEFHRRVVHDAWDDFSVADLLRAARILFSSDAMQRQELNDLRDFLIAETACTQQTAVASGMADVYFENFDARQGCFAALGNALLQAAPMLSRRWQSILASIPEVFLPARAPASIVDSMKLSSTPHQTLESLGIRFPHHGALMQEAHRVFVLHMQPYLQHLDGITKLINWINPKPSLIRHTDSSEVISALLRPWITDDPAIDLKDFLKQRLTGLFGDPRSSTYPWLLVEAEARDAFCRWFTTDTVNAFVRIVDHTIQKDRDIWSVSRAFWQAMDERRLVKDAFIALSTDAARAVQTTPSLIDGLNAKIGRQLPSAGYRDLSLMIMSIGNHIVVEGSHNFQTYIFHKDDKNRPRLPWDPLASQDEKRGIYDANQLRCAARRSLRHNPSEDWMREVMAVAKTG